MIARQIKGASTVKRNSKITECLNLCLTAMAAPRLRRVRTIPSLWILAFCCPCLAGSGLPPHMTFQTVSDFTISPAGTKAARPDTALFEEKFLVGYLQLAPVRAFRLLVLDKDLTAAGTTSLFSGRESPTDIRVCTGPGGVLFYAFETTSAHRGGPNHLNLARYQVTGTVATLTASSPEIDEAMPVIIPDKLPRPGDDLLDDPTPFLYQGRFYVVTRKWESATLKVRVFSPDLQPLETHNLDLGGAFPGLHLSVNSLVDVEGTPYLVAGAFDRPPSDPRCSSRIVAVGLDKSLTTAGRPVMLSQTSDYEGYVACCRCSEGVLFVGYDVLTKARPSGHKGMIEAFDTRNGFREMGALEINTSHMVDNHFTFEVLDRKLYVFYQTPDEEIRAKVVSVTVQQP